MYTLYEYKVDALKVGVITSEKETLLYLGSTLYSAKTNITPDKTNLNSDVTGRGLVKVELDPLRVTVAGKEVQVTHKHEESDKSAILQYWNSRLQASS